MPAGSAPRPPPRLPRDPATLRGLWGHRRDPQGSTLAVGIQPSTAALRRGPRRPGGGGSESRQDRDFQIPRFSNTSTDFDDTDVILKIKQAFFFKNHCHVYFLLAVGRGTRGRWSIPKAAENEKSTFFVIFDDFRWFWPPGWAGPSYGNP